MPQGEQTSAGLLWVDRTVSILTSLGEAARGSGITELSRAHHIPKSTLHRMLTALKRYDFVHQDLDTKRYHLGPALVRLGQRFLERFSIRQIARPHLQRLAEDSGLACFVSVLQNGEAVCIETIEGHYGSVSLFVRLGRSMPFNTSAAAKALLAFQPDEAVRRILAEQPALERFTPNSQTDLAEVLADLEKVRAQGFARSREELQVGVAALSVPVRGGGGAVMASLSVVGPLGAFPTEREAEVVAQLRQAAGLIATDLARAQLNPPGR